MRLYNKIKGNKRHQIDDELKKIFISQEGEREMPLSRGCQTNGECKKGQQQQIQAISQ